MGLEPSGDFLEALAQEPVRTAEHWYPGWRYHQNGSYAANLQPYYDRFARQQIRVYLYEEWNNQPGAVLTDIFQFLEVDPSFKPALAQRHNVSMAPRSQGLQKLLQKPSAAWHQWLVRWCVAANQSRPVLPATVYQQVTGQFQPSIEALEQLLTRSLRNWYG